MSKFKIGDYISADDTILIKIVAVMQEEKDKSIYPIYALSSSKMENIKWVTEYELEKKNFKKALPPDFEKFRKIKSGDVLKIECIHKGKNQTEYKYVIARVGDVCLLSRSPEKEMVQEINKLSEQIAELTEGQINILEDLSDDVKTSLKETESSLHNSKVADDWYHVDFLATLNWEIISEEN